MKASKKDINQCQFGNWYNIIPSGKTFKSRVIALPSEFIDYLHEDGVHLPASSRGYFAKDVLSDDEDDENLKEIEDDSHPKLHDFSALDKEVTAAIKTLGGEVVVKLNWSCPLDAVWMNAGTLKCQNPSDIYVLLKSSDRIMFDLAHMYDLCENADESSSTELSLPIDQVTLVLRKWANLNPAMEFRVFVYNKQIVGICQRDCSTHYDFLEEKIDEVQEAIYKLYYGSNWSAFETSKDLATKRAEETPIVDPPAPPQEEEFTVAGAFPLSNYTMDVYVDLKKRVWIVDFNPFGEPTCSLLFEWEELCMAGGKGWAGCERATETGTLYNASTTAEVQEHSTEPQRASGGGEGGFELCEFRIVETQATALPSTKGSTRGPIDVHAANDFHKFMAMCKAQQGEGDSSDDGEA